LPGVFHFKLSGYPVVFAAPLGLNIPRDASVAVLWLPWGIFQGAEQKLAAGRHMRQFFLNKATAQSLPLHFAEFRFFEFETRIKTESIMKFSIAVKRFSLAVAVFGAAITFLIISVPARTANQDDAAAFYKAKCAMCHGATAEKKFDATKPDAELIETTLKGKKGEKPPFMPAYADKGMTTEQATALVAFMKAQKQ
jgi:mono/diheme cytochrome c family protein